MSIQHQRVVELCNELRLGGVASQYTALAHKAAEKRTSFTDFVEELLIARGVGLVGASCRRSVLCVGDTRVRAATLLKQRAYMRILRAIRTAAKQSGEFALQRHEISDLRSRVVSRARRSRRRRVMSGRASQSIEMKFIIDGNPSASGRTDPALIKLVARAHRWFGDRRFHS